MPNLCNCGIIGEIKLKFVIIQLFCIGGVLDYAGKFNKIFPKQEKQI